MNRFEENVNIVWDIYHKCYKRMATINGIEEDIIQEGFIGLVRAEREFDDTKGTKFSTYAYTKVWGQMAHYVNRNYLTKTAKQNANNLSLEYTLEDYSRGVSEVIEAPATYKDVDLFLDFEKALESIPPKAQAVFRGIVYYKKPLAEIAKEQGFGERMAQAYKRKYKPKLQEKIKIIID